MQTRRLEVYRLRLNDNIRNGNHFKLSLLSEEQRQRRKIVIVDSEIVRILQTINPANREKDGSELCFIRDLVELDVGDYTTQYAKMPTIYIDDVPYVRAFCAAGDARSRKVWYCAEEQWPIVDEILRCGLDRSMMFPPSKYNAYTGMVHSSSVPVSTPRIVVIPEHKEPVRGTYDIVHYDPTSGSFSVDNNVPNKTVISPFDGAGLVSVEMAKRWRRELGSLKYLPSAFQFRALPGLKGVLFTFDFFDFARQNNCSKIVDVWGKTWDILDDKIDVIMTATQFKFCKLFDGIEQWQAAFEQKISGYTRTWNISTVAESPKELRDTSKLSYQHLQTLQFTANETKELTRPTINRIAKISSDVRLFLDYRGVSEYGDDGKKNDDWNRIPTYYRALNYNHDLGNDPFIRDRWQADVKSIINKACLGKINVAGNYQILAPDLYALAQCAFGLPVTGLLGANQIYSQYWFSKRRTEVDLVRNPHIANEHNLVSVVNSAEMSNWYKYQTATIVSSIKDTIALRCNSADFDGDRVLTTNNRYLIAAVKRNPSNTIVQADSNAAKAPECRLDDTASLMLADQRAMSCNIGAVIDPVTLLWSAYSANEDTHILDYIKAMSVVGSLTIDAAKTGEVVRIPPEIRRFIEDHIDKPYFLRFRPNTKNRKGGSLVKCDGQQECTVNKICRRIEAHTKGLGATKDNAQYDWTVMLSAAPNCDGAPYKRVREVLFQLQKQYNDISRCFSKCSDDGWQQRSYDCFFQRCRTQLLCAGGELNRTIDCVLTLYHVDSLFVSARNQSIIWNAFGDEMIRRAQGNFAVKAIAADNAKAEYARQRTAQMTEWAAGIEANIESARREKLLKKQKKAKRKAEKTRAEQIEAPDVFSSAALYDGDRSAIEKATSNVKEQRTLAALSALTHSGMDGPIIQRQPVAIKKGSRDDGTLSVSQLASASGTDRRNTERTLNNLCNAGKIKIELPRDNLMLVEYLVAPATAGNIIAEPRSITESQRLVQKMFPDV